MAKRFTSISISLKTRAKFDARKEDYYGEELASEVSQEKFIEDLLKEANYEQR